MFLQLAQVQFEPALFDDLCENTTVFESIFSMPPAGGDLTLPNVQSAMCALRPNVTLLLSQTLERIDGAQFLVDQVG